MLHEQTVPWCPVNCKCPETQYPGGSMTFGRKQFRRNNVWLNAGQLGIGSSRPGQTLALTHIKSGGNVFNKKELI